MIQQRRFAHDQFCAGFLGCGLQFPVGPQHGFGLAQRIQQISGGALNLNQGTLYPALLRLEHRGWIRSQWGVSGNNRRAKFYEITAAGRRQVEKESEDWARTVAIMDRFERLTETE